MRRARPRRPPQPRAARDHLRRRQFSGRGRRGDRAARPPAGDVRRARLGRPQSGRALHPPLDRDRAGGPFLPPRPRRALPRGGVHRHAAAAAAHADPPRLADDPVDAAHRRGSFAAATTGSCPALPRLFEEGGVRIIGVEASCAGNHRARRHAGPSTSLRRAIAPTSPARLKVIAALGAVRCRPGGGRRRWPCARRRSRRRHRQFAGAHRAIARRGAPDEAGRRRRSRQGAQAGSGSPLRSAGHRAEDGRECRARRSCRHCRRRRRRDRRRTRHR